MIRSFTLLFFSCLLAGGLLAQDQYTVELGAFQDVSQTDFAELLSLGFVYGNKVDNNVHQVYLGTFDELEQAEGITARMRQRGFTNARTLQRPPGQAVVMIQLATKVVGTVLDYEKLGRVGNLFVEQTNDRLKLMTGAYPDQNAAKTALAAIREMGYRDAFAKTVDFNRLIPVGPFETGVKKPLIPINMTQQPAVPSAYEQRVVTPTPNPAPQPNTTARTPAPTTYANTPGVTLPKAATPTIRSRFKRESASRLQTVLKEKGFYSGAIDGYYGANTQAAYQSAFGQQPDVQKYRALVPLLAVPADEPVLRWPSSALLLAVSKDLAGGLTDTQLAATAAATRRQLYASTSPLAPAAAARAGSWSKTLWTNLGKWAGEDPVHAHMVSAFRLAYFQTQVLLEDYYMDRGLAADAAKDLAVATLQHTVGPDLQRFLY